ncbi:MAG: ispD [Herbinix sp.]|jgi:2-C-methyl-D-erythritol 4-phosphate cytidylyltransferase|nr:ispD [Herbinix sp.]
MTHWGITMNKKITAIVLAAGQGKRMNIPVAKQFLILRERPVLYYSLKSFQDSLVDEIIIVTGKEQLEYCREHIVAPYPFSKVQAVIEGGKERYDSVFKALEYTTKSDYVLIHDGARPFITIEMINHIINEVKSVGACIFGTPVKDTIKVVDNDGFIKKTPDRSTLWAAQTPQAFDYLDIKRAYEKYYEDRNPNKNTITDDAMVYQEYIKKRVKIIQGDYTNIKLTTKEDIQLADKILENQTYA